MQGFNDKLDRIPKFYCGAATGGCDLLRLTPESMSEALDIGARDGYFSLLLADRFAKVTALDLTEPDIQHPKICCV